MGESHERLKRDGWPVKFDFSAPKLHVQSGDRRDWGGEMAALSCRKCAVDRSGLAPRILLYCDEHFHDEKVIPRAVRAVIAAAVMAAFPQMGAGRDRKVWGAWQEQMDDEGPCAVEVTCGMIEWLKDLFAREDVKIASGMAQWAEACEAYLRDLYAEALEAIRATPPA